MVVCLMLLSRVILFYRKRRETPSPGVCRGLSPRRLGRQASGIGNFFPMPQDRTAVMGFPQDRTASPVPHAQKLHPLVDGVFDILLMSVKSRRR
jgi:hypothetical protein